MATEPRPPSEVDPEELAESLAGYGAPAADIALVTGIPVAELEGRLAARLALGQAKARTRVAQAAYVLAASGRNFQATEAWLHHSGVWTADKAPEEPPEYDLTDIAVLDNARPKRRGAA